MLSRISRSLLPSLSLLRSSHLPKRSFTRAKVDVNQIPPLDEFLRQTQMAQNAAALEEQVDYTKHSNLVQDEKQAKNFFIETYGCQMNESDTEIVSSILQKAGFVATKEMSNAQIVLLNTCAIRENAETKVWNRLKELKHLKKKSKKQQMVIGVLGTELYGRETKGAASGKEQGSGSRGGAGRVPGPTSADPGSGEKADQSQYGINVQLSFEETYADVVPVRANPDSASAFISIMRGCNNMCSFCIVPFTRGRERSRPIESILDEVRALKDQGVKEITLLGQNVNSYHDVQDPTVVLEHENSKGFNEMYKLRQGAGARFDVLLQRCAEIAPETRFRFTSPHPKDFPERVLDVIKSYDNICKSIHLPAQSGNTEVLKRMRRNHTREAYLELVDRIRGKVPEMTFSTDLICGFCGETEQEFQDTMSLLDIVKYENAFLFAYSMRERTHAHRNYVDDVPAEVKQDRLERMIENFLRNQLITTQKDVGRYHIVLVEGRAKQQGQWKARTDTNRTCVFDTSKGVIGKIPVEIQEKIRNKTMNRVEFEEQVNRIQQSGEDSQLEKGDYVIVRVDSASNKTLHCTPIAKTTMSEFFYCTQKKPFFTLQQ